MIKKVYILKRSPLKKSQKPLKKTPLKRGNSQLKRTPIKKKAKSLQQREEEKKEQVKLWNFFMEIWRKRQHYSEISGVWVGNEPLTTMFDHLLEKSIYPEFKFSEWNIAIIHPDEHKMKTDGFPLPKHQELIERAKKIAELNKQEWH